LITFFKRFSEIITDKLDGIATLACMSAVFIPTEREILGIAPSRQ